MNKFATLKHIGSFKKVCFYSIQMENSAISLYEEFYIKHQNLVGFKQDLSTILSQIREIGLRGAKDYYFRHEGSAEALPSTFFGGNKSNLRLYCLRLSENVVILVSGGVKTKLKAQDCPNVSLHFKMANSLSKKFTSLIKEGEIRIEEKIIPRLQFEKELQIEFKL